jgi:hypothetical protein
MTRLRAVLPDETDGRAEGVVSHGAAEDQGDASLLRSAIVTVSGLLALIMEHYGATACDEG